MAAMLLALIILERYLPPVTSPIEIYPRLADSEYAQLQSTAESFADGLACLGITIERRDPSNHFFELSVRGTPILLVDNSGSQLLVITMSAEKIDAIGLHRWRQGWGTPWKRGWNLSAPESACPLSDAL